MSEYLIGVIIGAVVSLITVLINNWQQTKKRAVEEAVKEAKLDARLCNIEAKLDIHNGYAEKLGEIQKDMASMRTDVAVMKVNIDNLKKTGE